MVLARAIDSISRDLVFYPPNPTYKLESAGDGSGELCFRPKLRCVLLALVCSQKLAGKPLLHEAGLKLNRHLIRPYNLQ